MDPARERAIELVQRLMTGDFASESEEDEAVLELERLVPDPNVAGLIFWPSTHPLGSGIPEEELTPETVVELAFRYRPFAL